MCVFVCISAHGSEKSEEEGGGLREAGDGRGGGAVDGAPCTGSRRFAQLLTGRGPQPRAG